MGKEKRTRAAAAAADRKPNNMASTVVRGLAGLRRGATSLKTGRTTSVRNMSGGSYEEEMANTAMWRNVTFVGLPCIVGLTAYIFSQSHHHGHEQPAYSYLQIRNKEFPWGKDNLFDLLSGNVKKEE